MRCAVFTILLISAICFGGCKCGKDIGGSIHQQADSVRTEIRWRYIPIYDTVTVYIPVEKQTSVGEDSSHLETDFATSDAFVDTLGKLHHILENKQQKIDIPIEGNALVSDTNHYENHANVDSIYVPQPYPVEVIRPLRWWQKALMWSGGLAIIATAWIVFRRLKNAF